MEKHLKSILINGIILILLISCWNGYACSAFVYSRDGHILLAANTDACDKVDGLITVNKRNMAKWGDTPGNSGKFAQWVSKYGSVTFTYCSREITQYGMNEAGLTITTVGLPGSRGPDPDERPPLSGNFWAQYLLDNCATIDDVMAVESKIRLVNDKDQYLICDRNGRSLVVQCENGQMLYYSDKSLPAQVLTNEKYAECLRNSKNNHIPANDPYVSNQRFQAGSNALSAKSGMDKGQTVDFAFEVLDKMSQHPCTQWNIVFDIMSLTVYYRTQSANHIKHFSLLDFDFSCESKMMELDVNLNYSGNVFPYFTEYSSERNLNLLRKAFPQFGIHKTEGQLNKIIDYFDSFECTSGYK